MIQQAKFTLDAFGDQALDGYATEDTWNGFACPAFTFSQAQKVVEASNTAGLPASYDARTDEFKFTTATGALSNDSAHEEYVDTFGATEINGVKFYHIGTRSWTWWNENWDE